MERSLAFCWQKFYEHTLVMARVRRYRLAQGQARQTKSNKENGYVIKVLVMRLNREGGAIPLALAREN